MLIKLQLVISSFNNSFSKYIVNCCDKLPSINFPVIPVIVLLISFDDKSIFFENNLLYTSDVFISIVELESPIILHI